MTFRLKLHGHTQQSGKVFVAPFAFHYCDHVCEFISDRGALDGTDGTILVKKYDDTIQFCHPIVQPAQHPNHTFSCKRMMAAKFSKKRNSGPSCLCSHTNTSQGARFTWNPLVNDSWPDIAASIVTWGQLFFLSMFAGEKESVSVFSSYLLTEKSIHVRQVHLNVLLLR